jgi:AcrR family transcriptional regulator
LIGIMPVSDRGRIIKALDLIKTSDLNSAMTIDIANTTARKLLLMAECLFAEEGLDAVSTRRISSESGQRNNSALQYHFGSKAALLEALLEYRQSPINRRRMVLLETLQAQGRVADARALVEAMVRPFLELLTAEAQDSYYLSLVSQLHSQQRQELLFAGGQERGRSLRLLSEWLTQALAPLPVECCHLRQELASLTLVHTAAMWAHQRRLAGCPWSQGQLAQRTEQLVDFLVGALQAPASDIIHNN